MYNELRLQNFTVFSEVNLEFVEGLNVYVGENGAGKTHLLKVLYALLKHQSLVADPSRRETLDRTLVSVFKPNTLGRLVRRRQGVQVCEVKAVWDKKPFTFSLNTKQTQVDSSKVWQITQSPIFIPAKDILGHSVKFIEAYESGWLDFDVTYRDLLINAVPDVQKGAVPQEQQRLLKSLGNAMTGKVSRDKDGRYYLKDASGQIEFPLVAEGWRKLGLLWTLIRNGSLTGGNILLWDEPEANLNPEMFPVVSDILAKLAHTGTQIHLATHSYALIRELEFASKEVKASLRLFACKREEDKSVTVQPYNSFVELKPNPILREYERIFQMTVKEALGA